MSPRGCLLSILVFVLIVVAILWFALPPVIGGLAVGALENAGVHGTGTRVDVNANPPLRLLLLDADTVHITSTDASIQNVHADTVDVTLRDVSIGSRSFGFIEGTLTGITFTPATGPAFQAETVQVTGPEQDARVAITLDHASVQQLVATAVTNATDQKVSAVTLASPDRVTVKTAVGTVAGRLQVSPAGDLVIVPSTGGSIALVGTGPDEPVRLQSIQIAGDSLEMDGSINLTQ
jgi:hypothetical protein